MNFFPKDVINPKMKTKETEDSHDIYELLSIDSWDYIWILQQMP